MKNKLRNEIYNYTVIFEPAEEGGYIVHVPALQGLVTQGETFEEATEMVTDAIRLYLEELKDEQKEIPIEHGEAVVSKIKIAIQLPQLKPFEAVKVLKKLGFEEKRQSGSHLILKDPARGKIIPVPIHKGHDLKSGVLRNIIKQSGVEEQEFLRLLKEK